MKLKDVIKVTQGSVLTRGSDLNQEVKYCGAMDLMSDALAYLPPGSMLLTGLKNIQTIRTAEMAYVTAILFVRGKMPDLETIQLAEELGIPLIKTDFGMFESCGRLYQAGMASVPLTRRYP
ncbi:MAG: DRTGG domain-containing protein [Pseudomonadota bacterium]